MPRAGLSTLPLDAVRALRATLHGFSTLEQVSGFGLPTDIDRTFDRRIAGLAEAFTAWATPTKASRRP